MGAHTRETQKINQLMFQFIMPIFKTCHVNYRNDYINHKHFEMKKPLKQLPGQEHDGTTFCLLQSSHFFSTMLWNGFKKIKNNLKNSIYMALTITSIPECALFSSTAFLVIYLIFISRQIGAEPLTCEYFHKAEMEPVISATRRAKLTKTPLTLCPDE